MRKGGAPLRIGLYRVHVREVDHQPPVAHRLPGPGVAAAPDRNQELPFPGEGYGQAHVLCGRTPGDEGGMFVVHAVPDFTSAVILGMIGKEKRARHALAQLPDGSCLQLDLGAVQ